MTSHLTEVIENMVQQFEEEPRAWHIDTRGDWLREQASKLLSGVVEICSKEVQPVSTNEFYGDASIREMAHYKTGWNNALTKIESRLTPLKK